MWFNEYEKQNVRRNIGTSRPRIGGYPMPSWFSASLINQSRDSIGSSQHIVSRPQPNTAPAIAANQEEESEYEEIEQIGHSYTNMNPNSRRSSSGQGPGQQVCTLCGNLNPLVRCEMCNNQLFCGACNDMFHRHPKRHNHTRKLLENRPPLPLKVHSIQGPEVGKIFPVAPPRRNKKSGIRSANVSPTPTSSSRFHFDQMGSLRRSGGAGGTMVHRPLPTPPLHVRMEQQQQQQQFGLQSSQNGRGGKAFIGQNHPGVDRRQSAPYSPSLNHHRSSENFMIRSGSIANPGFGTHRNRGSAQQSPGDPHSGIPLTVMELGNQRHRHQDPPPKFPVEKYCLPPSRDSGWDEEEEEVLPPRAQRAFSVSACNLQQFPTSTSDASHFATLQRRGSSKPPARPPPPVPPRDFSQAPTPRAPPPRHLYPATSAFELDRAGGFVPWVEPGQPQHFSQHRGGPLVIQSPPRPRAPQFFEPQTSASEMNLQESSSRAGNQRPSYGNQEELFSKFGKSPQTPRKPPAPAPLEPEYYSGDEGEEEDDEPIELESLTANPEGPWTCEHCTFINPKSTRVCTVCCKTPVKGYRVESSSRHSVPPPMAKHKGDSDFELEGFGENELSPAAVVQSKLSFSTVKSRQSPQKINLSVEKVRKVKGSRQVVAVEKESESESDSSSEEDITERHRSYVRESSRSNTLQKGHCEDFEISHPTSPRGRSISESHTSAAGLKQRQTEMVECGTGDYSVLEPKFTSSQQKVKNNKAEPDPSHKAPLEERKSSKGTSPPPQTISTQTYEELPAHVRARQPSVSKMSTQSSSVQSRESSPPPRAVEMSEKALRYERRAQQHSQLKRSMSAHLHSSSGRGGGSSEVWAGQGHSQHHPEGRHLYRSSSRQSLASDTRSLPISGPPSRDMSPTRGRYNDDLRRFGPMPPSWDRFPSPADYFASIEDLVARKRRESVKSQEFELSRLLKEAEELNYTPEDLQVGLRMCGGDRNPVKWLEDNWTNMVETVQTLATKFGRDKGQEYNEVGTISPPEAKDALRLHKGNVWAAVTECVERRRKKFLELQSRGTFLREDILTALTANQGSLDAAYVELSKNQLKPFLMRIWGPPIGKDNESAPPPRRPETPPNLPFPEKPQEDPPSPQKSPSSRVDSADAFVEGGRGGAANNVDCGVPNSPAPAETQELSPEINEPKVISPAGSETVMKTDAEEETFYDLDLEPLGRSQSISDGDMEDSEAHVSAFIQNYQVPPPPPSPIIPDRLPVMTEEEEGREVGLEVMGGHKGEITGNNCGANDSPTSPLLDGNGQSEDRILRDDSVTPETLATLTKAVSVIAGQLGVLLQHQQNLASSSERENSLNERILKGGGGGGESQEEEARRRTFPLDEMKENDIQVLRNIYSEELKELALTENLVVKDTVLREEKVMTTPQGQRSGAEKVGPPPPPLQSTSSKIYEVLGNLAGSLLGGGKSKSSKSKSQTEEEEEDPYETVTVSSPGGSLEVVDRNKVLADLLEDFQIDSSSSPSTNPQIRHPNSSQSPTTNRKKELEYFDISHLSLPSPSSLISSSTTSSIGEENEIGNPRKNQFPTTGYDDFEMKLENYSGRSESGESEGGEEGFGRVWEDEDLNQETSADDVRFNLQNPTPSAASSVASVLLTSGRVDSMEKAQLAFQLMDMNFSEEDSVHAANECSTLYSAISFLQQECFLCAGKFSAKEMISMLRCKHSCCRTCAGEYFMVQIRDHSIIEATCPFCKEPTNLNEASLADEASDYFSHLEILIKDLLNQHFYEMFGRKLRDWTLAKTPNFKWCSKCSSGFITEPLQTHLICPDCNAVTCAICLEPWDKFNHEHRDRDRSRTQVFCDENSAGSGAQPKSIVEYLNENNVECPECHLKFALARGGCMHLTCSQCRYEFCSGCSAPFAMGLRCKNNASFCAKLGLHAHHPRNCLFYLRDKEPDLLKKLLMESAVKFVEKAEDELGERPPRPSGKCIVALQKETPDGLIDDFCGQEVTKESSDVCQIHYVEYLGLLVWENRLDPIPILSNDDLETIVKRACKKMPPRSYGTTEGEYRPLLLKVIEEEIPL